MGRHIKFSKELGDAICDRLANGESLRTICADDDMPSRVTIMRWLGSGEYPEFVAIHAQAREAQADYLAEEILAIADTPEPGTKTTSKEWGEEVTEADMIEHRKLRVATRQWIAERMNPKKYGTKQQVEMSGSLDLNKMSDDELDEELAQLVAVQAAIVADTDSVDDLV